MPRSAGSSLCIALTPGPRLTQWSPSLGQRKGQRGVLSHWQTFRGCFWHIFLLKLTLQWTSLNGLPSDYFFLEFPEAEALGSSYSFLFRASTYLESCVKWRWKQIHWCTFVHEDYMGWYIPVIIPGTYQLLTCIRAIIFSLLSGGAGDSIAALKSRIWFSPLPLHWLWVVQRTHWGFCFFTWKKESLLPSLLEGRFLKPT